MRAKRILVGALVVVVTGLPWLLSGTSRASVQDDETPLARVERRSFSVYVRTVGELEPVRSTMISSELRGDRGKLVQIVEDGSEVEEGDVLVRFDPTPFEEERRGAELDVIKAESVVEVRRQLLEWEKAQAERQVRTAEFDYEVAVLEAHKLEKGDGPLELARLEGELTDAQEGRENQLSYLDELEELRSQGFVNEAEVAQIEKAAEKAARSLDIVRRQFESYRDFILPSKLAALKAQVERGEMELEQTKISSGFKIGEAQAALDQAERELDAARARLEEAESQLARTVIRAPMAGMVVHRDEFRDRERRKPRVGDAVWQNQALLYLPDLSRMLVTTRVREVDLHKVQPGNAARVRVDAYPDSVFPATVQSIGVLAEHRQGFRSGEKYFRLTVALEEGDERLRPGMTARVEILSAEVERRPTVPLNAIWQDGESSFCYVLVGSRFERREVTVGPSDQQWIVVEDGLSEGELVSLVQPDPQRVWKPGRADG